MPGDPGHDRAKKRAVAKTPTLAFLHCSAARQLLAGAFRRHSRFLLPGMAHLFGGGDCANDFRLAGALAPRKEDRSADIGLSVPGGILHIRAMAHFLLLRTSLREVQRYGNRLHCDDPEAA